MGNVIGWKVLDTKIVAREVEPEGTMTGGVYKTHRYREGEWTNQHRGYGPLCLYDNLEAAIKLVADWEKDQKMKRGMARRRGGINLKEKPVSTNPLIIYECEYSPTTCQEVYVPGYDRLHLSHLPKGTVLTWTCLPIKKVYVGEVSLDELDS